MFILSTINARYQHASFGLRYLAANMGELSSRTRIEEFTLRNDTTQMADRLLASDPRSGEAPRVIGLGVYIWNVSATAALLAELKRRAPQTTVVLGGPEVSHELDVQAWTHAADYVVQGEGDLAFAQLCRRVESGHRPLTRVLQGGTPDLAELRLPYDLYTDHDLEARMLYVEASRGCPYRCEFCLSSLDKKVRAFDLDQLLAAFDELIARGAKHFKFVDRTFNLDLARSRAILEFFREHYRPGMFLHFEMVPDRLPPELREIIASFPPGAMQFEVGIQSFDPEVGKRIQRRQNIDKTLANLDWLVRETGVHVHADLIAGLPGEGLRSFAAGFDRLHATGVQEIQVGILKRLRGTPIARHAEPFDMRFDAAAPYQVRQTADLSAEELERIEAFAHAWDVFANQGRFARTLPRLWSGADSVFERFMQFASWHLRESGQLHGVSLHERLRLLVAYLTERLNQPEPDVLADALRDLLEGGHKLPKWLRAAVPRERIDEAQRAYESGHGAVPGIPARQARHLVSRA